MSIKKLDKNKYLVRVNVTIAPGTYKRLNKTVYSYKEAKETELQMKAQSKMDDNIYFRDMAVLFLRDYSEKHKATSYRTVMLIVTKKIVPYFGEYPIKKITSGQIHAWQITLANLDISSLYVRQIEKVLSLMFSFAVKFLRLKKSPCENMRHIGETTTREMNFWTIDEFKKVISVIPDDSMSTYEFKQLLLVLFLCGTRVGEALALQRRDINFKRGTISITKTLAVIDGVESMNSPKTQSSIRTITMPKILSKQLSDYIKRQSYENKEERIFKDFQQYKVLKYLYRYAKKAKVKQIRVHDLRHSAISYWIQLGMPIYEISRRCGHASPKITYEIYAHLYPKQDNRIANLLEEIKEKWDEEQKNR